MRDYLHFVRQQWAALLFGFLAVFGGNFGQSFFVGLFGQGIQQTLGLSASQYSGAYSLATLGSALTVIWLGEWIDRVSLRAYTLFVCVGLAVAALVLWRADTFLWLLGGFFLLRLFGQALLPHTGATTMARYFDSHRGKAISIASSGFPAGEIVLPLLATTLILQLGWQDTYLLIGLFVLLLLLPLLLWLERASGMEGGRPGVALPRTSARAPPSARRALLGDYRYWLAVPGLMAGPFIATAIFIHQNYILEEKGWSLTWYALCFTVYGLVHWLSGMVCGVLVDRYRATTLLPYLPLPLAGALLVLALVPGAGSALAMMALLALSVGCSPVVTGSLWPEIYGARNIGAIRSINIALVVFATSLSPFILGFLIDGGVPLPAIMVTGAGAVLVCCLLLRLSYTARPQQHPIALAGDGSS